MNALKFVGISVATIAGTVVAVKLVKGYLREKAFRDFEREVAEMHANLDKVYGAANSNSPNRGC